MDATHLPPPAACSGGPHLCGDVEAVHPQAMPDGGRLLCQRQHSHLGRGKALSCVDRHGVVRSGEGPRAGGECVIHAAPTNKRHKKNKLRKKRQVGLFAISPVMKCTNHGGRGALYSAVPIDHCLLVSLASMNAEYLWDILCPYVELCVT